MKHLFFLIAIIFLILPFAAEADIFVPKICNSNQDCPKEVMGRSVSCRDYYDVWMAISSGSGYGLKRCLPPEVGQGGDCSDNLYGPYLCKGPLICFFDEGKTETSKCLSPRKEGESCNIADDWQCEGNLVCYNKKCVSGVNKGEKCSPPTIYCGKGLQCDMYVGSTDFQTCITSKEYSEKYGGGSTSTTGGTSTVGTSTAGAKFTSSWPFVGKATTPQEFIAALFKLGLMIGGLLAFGSIVYAGIVYVFSVGNSSKQADARDRIYMALLGLLILGLSYLILSTISGEFVIFKAKLEPEGFVYVPPVPIVGGWFCSKGECAKSNNGNYTEEECKKKCSSTCQNWHEACEGAITKPCCGDYKCVEFGTMGQKYCNGDYKWSCQTGGTTGVCKVEKGGFFESSGECQGACDRLCGDNRKGICFYKKINLPCAVLPCPKGYKGYSEGSNVCPSGRCCCIAE